jgi:hypothetical protein
MAQCEFVQECFFTMNFSNNMPSRLAVIKRTYCNHEFEKCARLNVFRFHGLDNVPKDLEPSDLELSYKIICQETLQ